MEVSKSAIRQFQREVQQYYSHNSRHGLPWRLPATDGSFDPYKIMVSELMLQQTQVNRVLPKYHGFLAIFPTVHSLAGAPLGQVIATWSGLGYNRRAKYLHGAAKEIVNRHNGMVPDTITELVKLPGIGKNTAGAIMAYAYNQPVIFVETNIRTAIIHHFYADKSDIPDSEITDLVEKTLDHDDPRAWYWALMDYGSYIKQTIGNLNKLSKAYSKQSVFQGSRRQLRGQVLRALADMPRSARELHIADERLADVLKTLVAEGMIQKTEGRYHL